MRALIIALLLLAPQTGAAYRADVEAFRKQRETEINGPTGWAALVGLHWLTAGTFTIGRTPGSQIALAGPSAPATLGKISVTDHDATIALAPGVAGTVKNAPVTSVTLQPNSDIDTALVVGKTSMIVIRRGQRLALRVWDSAAPNRTKYAHLTWMAIDPKWRFNATFIPHANPPKMKIQNVLGETIEMTNPGAVEFVTGGKTIRLEALLESDDAKEFFFMFKDATSNKTTYGAGRYLYTPLPKDGHVDLDFNKADNPPCAFTDFATCPLPPLPNRLTIAVPAGETYAKH